VTSSSEIDSIFEFITFSSQLRNIQRHNHGSVGRPETVAEHSWHLALMCWVLHTHFEAEFCQPLDLMKMIKICLMHDLVEIDAGDPSAWQTTAASKNTKQQLEGISAHTRFGALPHNLSEEFLSLWRECESALSLEAKLVKAVDRLNPAMMRYLTKQGWSDVNATPADLDALQLPRVSISPILLRFYALIKELSIKEGLLAESYP
jgi:putative hydrolases of HD superfamily